MSECQTKLAPGRCQGARRLTPRVSSSKVTLVRFLSAVLDRARRPCVGGVLMSTNEPARRVIEFDHHSPDLTAEVTDLGVGVSLSPLRERCPIGWTEAHGGYWVATGYDEIQKISRNDDVFSSDHDPMGRRKSYTGVTIPPTYPIPLGFIEMDAPEHTLIRKALLPWFTQKAVEGWRPVLEDLTTAFIDRVIEAGECDFIEAIASPVPAVLTMMLLGAPLERWGLWSAAHHRTVAA